MDIGLLLLDPVLELRSWVLFSLSHLALLLVKTDNKEEIQIKSDIQDWRSLRGTSTVSGAVQTWAVLVSSWLLSNDFP